MDEAWLLAKVQDFVALQIALVASFRAAFPDVKDLDDLLDAPRVGMVEFEGRPWRLQRHGVGFAFCSQDAVLVDVHRQFTSPERFDAWRIMLYLESIGSDVELAEVEAGLSRLTAGGRIVQVEERVYKLAEG